jgi:polyisoprenyl-phosphate glycosyltransferase
LPTMTDGSSPEWIPSSDPITQNQTLIVIPVFDDWAAVRMLLNILDDLVARNRMSASVLIVDDGSNVRWEESGDFAPLAAIQRVEILRLRRNLGHQRAICVGLVYAHTHFPESNVLIMDGDGEDKPSDIPALTAAFAADHCRSIIFAKRQRRSESLTFRVGYAAYRSVHRVLTGHSVRFGNFSILSPEHVSRLVVTSETWNHYAAAVVVSRMPYLMVPTERGKRLDGKSSMNTLALMVHGFSAVSVYSDIVSVRLLIAMGLLSLFCCLAIAGVVLVRLASNLAVPGWGTYTTGLLAVVLLQTITVSLFFVFGSLGDRSRPEFIPLRDCPLFVAGTYSVFVHEKTAAR